MTVVPHMPCQEFVERVTDYLEGALSPLDRTRLEEHLGACQKCAHYLAQLEITRNLSGRLSEDDVTPEMRGELLDVFSRWNAERHERRGRQGDPEA